MKIILFLFSSLVMCCSCKNNNIKKNYDFQADIRLGNKYYSIYIDKQGQGYVSKGQASFYTEPIKVKSSLISKTFQVDSVSLFWESVNEMKSNPEIDDRKSDAPRVEIYYYKEKIYDSFMWKGNIWDVFRPLMDKLPKDFNPLLVSDHPFDS